MGALLLCAISYESYLNWIGPKLFPTWKQKLERLRWAKKTKLIAEKLGLTLDYSKKPYKTVRQLFTWRNELAHSQPCILHEEALVPKLGADFYDMPQTELEKNYTNERIDEFERDVTNVVNAMHEKAWGKVKLTEQEAMLITTEQCWKSVCWDIGMFSGGSSEIP